MAFATLDDQLVPSVSVAQMREVDRIVTEQSAFALTEMMEMAGKNLSDFVIHQWPRGVRIGPVVVLAGKGHNGGGGICCATHLLFSGIDVRLCLSSPGNNLTKVTAGQLNRFQKLNGNVISFDELGQVSPFLILDAMIGYNLVGTPGDQVAKLAHWANNHSVPIISLDVPTGLNADTGIPTGICIKAEKTVTLALPKNGLGSKAVGELWLSDIGINRDVYEKIGISLKSPFAGAPLIRLKRNKSTSPHLPGIPL